MNTRWFITGIWPTSFAHNSLNLFSLDGFRNTGLLSAVRRVVSFISFVWSATCCFPVHSNITTWEMDRTTCVKGLTFVGNQGVFRVLEWLVWHSFFKGHYSLGSDSWAILEWPKTQLPLFFFFPGWDLSRVMKRFFWIDRFEWIVCSSGSWVEPATSDLVYQDIPSWPSVSMLWPAQAGGARLRRPLLPG